MVIFQALRTEGRIATGAGKRFLAGAAIRACRKLKLLGAGLGKFHHSSFLNGRCLGSLGSPCLRFLRSLRFLNLLLAFLGPDGVEYPDDVGKRPFFPVETVVLAFNSISNGRAAEQFFLERKFKRL